MKRTSLKNAPIITMDPDRRVLTNHVLIVEGDSIKEIVPSSKWAPSPEEDVIDLRGRYILPGLINSHVHVVQQLARGLSDDVDILTWLHDRIWPYESNLHPEDSYINTLMTGVEQIRNGVTTMCDAGMHHPEATVRGISELGMRSQLCYSIMDCGDGLPEAWQLTPDQCISIQEAAHQRFNGAAEGRVQWFLGLRTLMNNSDELVEKTVASAEKLDTWVHMHVAEGPAEHEIITASRGTTTVRHLHRLGLLGPRFLAVHCQGLDEEEMDLFVENDVKVSHNPAAALRVMGLSPIVEMVDKGITVSIATDGAPSNCRNSLIDEIFLAAVLQKGRKQDSRVMPAEKILEMITIDAARCVGLEKEIGSIETGKMADLCVINPLSPEMQPMHDPISNMVFSMKPHNIESTMCNGVWLMRDRNLTQIDLDALLEEAARRAAEIRERAGIKLPKRFNWV